ncbi:hypothetical protein ACJXB3_004470, partial [Vibrio parahaemolyticus]
RLKRQNKTTILKIERNFSTPHPDTKLSKIAQFIGLKLSALAAFLPLATNAQLRCEARYHNTQTGRSNH